MKAELRLVNALIAMSVPSTTWPTILADQGFTVSSIQRDVSILIGGSSRIVTPEVIFHSEDYCLVIESKSSTFSEPQARKYWLVTAQDMRDSGCLPSGATGTEGAVPTYFCQAMHSEALGGRIDTFNDQEGADLPLVDYDNHRFQLTTRDDGSSRGRIRNPALESEFRSGVYFNESTWPTRFVPFDEESDPLEMMRPVLSTQLRHLLHHPDVVEFTAEHLLGGHPDAGDDGALVYWNQLGSQARRRLIEIVFAMVEEFRVHYLTRYLSRLESPKGWRKTIEAVDHPAQYRKVHESIGDYIQRKESGVDLPLSGNTGQEELEFPDS